MLRGRTQHGLAVADVDFVDVHNALVFKLQRDHALLIQIDQHFGDLADRVASAIAQRLAAQIHVVILQLPVLQRGKLLDIVLAAALRRVAMVPNASNRPMFRCFLQGRGRSRSRATRRPTQKGQRRTLESRDDRCGRQGGGGDSRRAPSRVQSAPLTRHRHGGRVTARSPIAMICPPLRGRVVRPRRLELPRPFGHNDLNVARLPIPPWPHTMEWGEAPSAEGAGSRGAGRVQGGIAG